MAHVWRGLIEEYRDRLPVTDATPVVSLREGGTPLVYAPGIWRWVMLAIKNLPRFVMRKIGF